jgi:hypothetical protein
MSLFTHAERVHRLVKEALDRGTASSLEEGEALFRHYRLVVEIGASQACSAVHQATLLTAVALGRRVFLGGVLVRLGANAPLLVPLPIAHTLCEAIAELGGLVSDEAVTDEIPHIVIGGAPRPRQVIFEVRTVVIGWRGGIVPVEWAEEDRGETAVPLAAMLAAALAINESFLHARGENASAGNRSAGLSLWNPHRENDWLADLVDEPKLSLLPSRLWLLGLGHLGQSFLWALGLLPYAEPKGLELIMQDIDIITPSTESTSILTDAQHTSQKKTRAMAAWAERRGFSTAIHERRFASGFRRQEDEPPIILCGLDNALGRRALDEAGFEFVVEAGLGRGYQDFRTLRLHTLPASRSAARIWPHITEPANFPASPAYKKLMDDGVLDRCGMTLLANKAVGAPFVGAVAATLVVAEVLRLLHGGVCLQLVDLDLQCLEHREIVPQRRDFSQFNPGYLRAAADRS